MRIKRHRRKLRGKYSGNCLSCNAKWSKCWYIASEDNQREWENRLKCPVTPANDEVCFQCWDAKIRTSPKRKIHFKTEINTNADIEMNSNDNALPTKMEMRAKKRSLNADFDYSFSTKNRTSKKANNNNNNNKENVQNSHFISLDVVDDTISSSSDGSISSEEELNNNFIFEEDNAIFILSTAFRTKNNNYNSINSITTTANINTGNNFTFNLITTTTASPALRVPSPSDFAEIKSDSLNLGDISFVESPGYSEDSGDKNKRKRGAYLCGKCGMLKKGHVCPNPSPKFTQPVVPPPPPQAQSVNL